MSLLHRTHNDSGELPELTPEQLAELDALDAALAGEEIADDSLAALVREVRASAPELGTDSTQQLNDRLGVALDPNVRAAGSRRLRGLLHGPGAVAASLLVVVALGGGTIAVVGNGSDDDMAVSVSGSEIVRAASAPSGAESDSAAGGSAASDSATSEVVPPLSRNSAAAPERLSTMAPTTSGGGASAAGSSGLAQTLRSTSSDRNTAGRAVERAIDLAVRVKTGELPDASRKVSQITRDANGYVASSDMNLGTAGAGNASFSLRVDSSKLDRAVDRLSALGAVTRQNESSQDITSTLDSATQQLADARKTRAALLKALGKATDATEIARLRAQIASNRRTLARLDANVQRVERRASLTTISLALDAPSKGDPSADDGNWSLGDAAGDAWSALRAILGGLLVGLAVVAPFALLGGAGYAIWSRRRRTARERALDA